MFKKLLFLFIFLPFLEIYLLIESGRAIGVWPTILLVVATGIAGSWLMRQQGFALLSRIRRELAAGHLPTGVLLDGALIFAGGILLLTPGFCTDLIGATMLIPATRALWRKALASWLAAKFAGGQMVVRRI